MPRLYKIVLAVLLIWLICFDSLFLLAGIIDKDPVMEAVAKMAWGLTLVWILLGGTLMYRIRDRVREYVRQIRLDWRVTFVLFATVLALIEEAVTVSLTNLAPVLGSSDAFITASTNYFDVVLFHSVVVFIPLFIAWALILSWYDFSPFAVFLLFGIMGIVAEVMFGGPAQLFASARWIFVYGLMVYLPTYSIPKERGAKPARFYHYVMAVPLAFLIALPLLIPLVGFITGIIDHPRIHF